MWTELITLLRSAHEQPSKEENCFTVRPLPNPRLGWIGYSEDCGAAFLLRVAPDKNTQHAITLPSIRVRHQMHVRIDDGTSQSEEILSVVQCVPHDEATIELFARCIGSVVTTDAATVSASALADVINRLLGLFRDFAHATDAEILGLWAELLVITHSSDPSSMLQWWRTSLNSRFDFGTEDERLDVKATTLAVRHHELSSDQASPPVGTVSAFASVMTEHVSSGRTVRELWHHALSLVPQAQEKIDNICVHTLGRDWQIVQHHAFDLPMALQTLRVYAAADVPHIDTLPDGVIRARFLSDFDRATPWRGRAPTPSGPIAATLAAIQLHPGKVS